MRPETEEEASARAWVELRQRQVDATQASLADAEGQLRKAKEAYAVARPLTEAERDMLVEHVAVGGQLCCDKGLAWLSEHLPGPWAAAINEWAYGALGCGLDRHRESDRRWLDDYVARVKRLRLDKLPVR